MMRSYITPADGMTFEVRMRNGDKLLRLEVTEASGQAEVHVGIYRGTAGEEEGYRYKIKDATGKQQLLQRIFELARMGATTSEFYREKYNLSTDFRVDPDE